MPVTQRPELATELSDATRIGVAWRELRRGAAMQAVRSYIFGAGAGALDMGQVDFLDLLVQRDSWRMHELSLALRVDRSTATRAVNRLVDATLAERSAAPGDARGVLVRATDAGRRVQADIAARRRRFLDASLGALDASERAALADLLERLVQGVDDFAGITTGGRSAAG